jgi:DNA helicase-2/ATP-dependent DNA helicase PcrA
MDKRIILAVAGAGKTYHICHEVEPQKRSLILAYTHENIHNIKNELKDAFGQIPESTTVMTFDSFVYRHFICPYEPTISAYFGLEEFQSNGITTIEPPSKNISKKGRSSPNPKYKNKKNFEHYITSVKQYYCANISELVTYVNKSKTSLIKRASNRLNLFYDQIFIDEFQDFREYDYDLIVELSKYLNSILLVGDYYQHSVSAINNSGKPFKKGKEDVCYADFVSNLKKLKFNIDENTLNKSRRCSKDICDFVKGKLRINIESTGSNVGEVKWVNENDIDAILRTPNILKLVYKKAANYTFEAMNWSYSKGNTVEAACIILTDKFELLDANNFSLTGIPTPTINKLYVAMTRSKGDLFLIKASDFKKYKNTYYKE